MALKYVRSGAAGAGTGADWANAYVTLALAFAGMSAGDTAYVAHDHAETTAGAVALTSPGTEANPCFVICVNAAGTVPPVSADLRATATVTSTGNSAITFNGAVYCYGIIFSAASGAVAAGIVCGTTAANWLYFKACALRNGGTGAAALIFGGVTANIRSRVTLDNTTLQFAGVGNYVLVRSCAFRWINTPSAITGATFPTILFDDTGSTVLSHDVVWLEGVDLSALGSGKTIVGQQDRPGIVVLKDCKLNALATIAATPGGPGGVVTHVIRSDSAGTNYRHEKIHYLGTQTVELTIFRTGGASDGTTPIAQKVVATANAKPVMPFEMLPIAVWNDATGSRTVTIEGIWGGGAVPTNADIWLDVEYLSDASSGQGAFVSGGKADVLAAASNLAAGSGTWGGSTTKFTLTATFTAAQKGAVYCHVKVGAASGTFYIDPKVVLS